MNHCKISYLIFCLLIDFSLFASTAEKKNQPEILGKGSYGEVSVINEKKVIKKSVFSHEHELSTARNIKEIAVLNYLNHHNIIKAESSKISEKTNSYETWLILPRGQNLTTGSISFSRYLKDAGAALSYAHEKGIAHLDFKPQHALLVDGVLKVIDWGGAQVNAHFIRSENPATTLWYESPESMLNITDNLFAVDVWSLAMSTLETIYGFSDFYTENYKIEGRQLCKIFYYLGIPTFQDNRIYEKWITQSTRITRTAGYPIITQEKKSIRAYLPDIPSHEAVILDKMLNYNTKKRLTMEQLINLPYIASKTEEKEEKSFTAEKLEEPEQRVNMEKLPLREKSISYLSEFFSYNFETKKIRKDELQVVYIDAIAILDKILLSKYKTNDAYEVALVSYVLSFWLSDIAIFAHDFPLDITDDQTKEIYTKIKNVLNIIKMNLIVDHAHRLLLKEITELSLPEQIALRWAIIYYTASSINNMPKKSYNFIADLVKYFLTNNREGLEIQFHETCINDMKVIAKNISLVNPFFKESAFNDMYTQLKISRSRYLKNRHLSGYGLAHAKSSGHLPKVLAKYPSTAQMPK